jgi:hypothetical protein
MTTTVPWVHTWTHQPPHADARSGTLPAFGRDVTLVMATAGSLPLQPFHMQMLKPFSSLKVGCLKIMMHW